METYEDDTAATGLHHVSNFASCEKTAEPSEIVKEKKVTTHHDFNPCSLYKNEVTKSVLITTENPEHVDTACGLTEDPPHTHGSNDIDKTHKDKT